MGIGSECTYLLVERGDAMSECSFAHCVGGGEEERVGMRGRGKVQALEKSIHDDAPNYPILLFHVAAG